MRKLDNKALKILTVGFHLTNYKTRKDHKNKNWRWIGPLLENKYQYIHDKHDIQLPQLQMITLIEWLALYIIHNICMLNWYTNKMLGRKYPKKKVGKK